ncbi:MAG: major capsid protein [Prevotella sp.]|nr:major capsid protein [Prevotella sp.]
MAQNTSIFAAYVDKFFKGFVGRFTEYWNGKKQQPTYLYPTMLREEYTPDLTWNSTSLNNSIVAADVVAMDSPLPLKRRGTLSRASGEVAKLGIKKSLKEKEISDIMVMESKGQQEADIARRILNNVPKVIGGIQTRVEIMFEQALSSGQILIADDNMEGLGIRVDFGYKDANKFHAIAAAWSDSEHALPLDDIRQLFDAADANSDSISDVYLSEAYFNYARKCQDVKELVATANNQVIISAATLPMPNRQKTLEALGDEFGATFHIVNNSYMVEAKNGTQTPVKPWEQGNVVGVPSATVGRLVYGTLAEDMNRVAGVSYQNSGFILVSEYSHNEPSLEEFTAAQALVMPVIDDGEHIYVLHASGTGVIDTDVDKVTFTAAANTTGKKVKVVHADLPWTAAVPVADSWCTITTAGNEITVKVSANNGSGAVKRTTVLTITDSEGNTATVDIEQAA